jgi:hypothetical protein
VVKCAQYGAGIAADLQTVTVQNVVLVPHRLWRVGETGGVPRAEIAGVGVAGDEPQRRSLAGSGQDEGRSRCLAWWRYDSLMLGVVKPPVVGERLRTPDTLDDLDCLSEGRLSLRNRWEGESEL